jgi:hypothetical protein
VRDLGDVAERVRREQLGVVVDLDEDVVVGVGERGVDEPVDCLVDADVVGARIRVCGRYVETSQSTVPSRLPLSRTKWSKSHPAFSRSVLKHVCE